MTTPAQPSQNPSAQARKSLDVAGGSYKATNAVADHADFMALSTALAGERPIAYSVNLARITGDVKATLFLSQLIYWTRVGVNVEHHGGWIFKSREQWTGETGLSRYEQETARVKLIKQGLIEEARVGSPARNCYRVVPQVLGTALARLLRSEPVQWTLFDIRSNAEQFKALLGRHLAFYRVFTEITPTVASAVFLTKAISVHRNVLSAQLEREARATAKPSDQSADWFSLSPSQWQDETGLTSAQQRECKQKLCQLTYISEAIQTYPKKRTYIQLNLSTVSAALKSYVFNKLSKGEGSRGLLGVLARGVIQQNNIRRDFVVGHDDGVRKDCVVNTGYGVRKDCVVNTQKIDFSPLCENPPSSFHESTNLDGGKSHIRRMEITHQSVGNSTVRRGLLTPLHARVRSLTTKDFNTTTTTTPKVTLEPSVKTIHQDGGKSHNVVVVVSESNQSQERKPVDQAESGLIWFDWMQGFVKDTCSQLLKPSGLPLARQQVLIAELAGNLLEANKVKNPLTYFASLIRNEKSTHGGIVPLAAQNAWQKRQYELEGAERLKNAIANSPQRSDAEIQQVSQDIRMSPAQKAMQLEIAEKQAAISKPSVTTPESIKRAQEAREKLLAWRKAIPIPVKSTKP
jgi:hypothetical protein